MNDHAAFEGELAAYLLDALDPPETAAFEQHLAGCALCQSQARWLQGAVDMLPESVEQLQPPPQLRERLVTEVRDQASPSVEPRRSRRRFELRSLFTRPAFGLATACVLIAAIAGYAVGTGGDGDNASSGQTTIAASATAAEPGARAKVMSSGDSGMLMVERLPVQPPGKVYEVWMRSGDRVEPATLFVVRPDGSGAAALPHGMKDADELMVTLEPERGSATPTSQPVLRAEV